MADFFRAGKKQKAGELMITALNWGAGSQAGLKLAAYLYEKERLRRRDRYIPSILRKTEPT